MHLPFVSRARYNDLLTRNAELERERKHLLNLYLMAEGRDPVYVDDASAGRPLSITAKNPPASDGAGSETQRLSMATFDRVETRANQAAATGAVKDWLQTRRKVNA